MTKSFGSTPRYSPTARSRSSSGVLPGCYHETSFLGLVKTKPGSEVFGEAGEVQTAATCADATPVVITPEARLELMPPPFSRTLWPAIWTHREAKVGERVMRRISAGNKLRGFNPQPCSRYNRTSPAYFVLLGGQSASGSFTKPAGMQVPSWHSNPWQGGSIPVPDVWDAASAGTGVRTSAAEASAATARGATARARCINDSSLVAMGA